MERIEEQILKDLQDGILSRKEIANKYGVAQGFVMRVGDNYKNWSRTVNKPATTTPVVAPTTTQGLYPPMNIFGHVFHIASSDKTLMALAEVFTGASKKAIQKKFSLRPVDAQNIKQASFIFNAATEGLNQTGRGSIGRNNPVVNELMKSVMGRNVPTDTYRIDVLMSSSGKYVFKLYDSDGKELTERTTVRPADTEPKSVEIPTVDLKDLKAKPLEVEEDTPEPRRRKYNKIPDDVKQSIIDMWVRSKDMSYSELAKLYEISWGSVYNIIKQFNEGTLKLEGFDPNNIGKPKIVFKEPEPTSKVVEPAPEPKPIEHTSSVVASRADIVIEEEMPEEVEKETPDRIPIGAESVLRIGLVSDRHDLPVDDFLFNTGEILDDYLDNFDKLDRFIDLYLKDHIKYNKDGYATTSIVLYCTGIQAPMAALIKQCQRKHINLTLRHWNPKTKTFPAQVIWDEFSAPSMAVPKPIAELISNARFAYAYKCKIDDLAKATKVYKITKVVYKDYRNEVRKNNTFVGDIDFQEMSLTTDENAAYDAYFEILKQFRDYARATSVIIKEMVRNSHTESFNRDNVLMMSKNY